MFVVIIRPINHLDTFITENKRIKPTVISLSNIPYLPLEHVLTTNITIINQLKSIITYVPLLSSLCHPYHILFIATISPFFIIIGFLIIVFIILPFSFSFTHIIDGNFSRNTNVRNNRLYPINEHNIFDVIRYNC